MTDLSLPTCPHCGSTQLISRSGGRRVFIDHEGARVPLLTVNYCLDRPVIEEDATTLVCSCDWSGLRQR